MSSKETARFVGFRLYEKQRIIIRKWSRAWKCGEAEALRRILDTTVAPDWLKKLNRELE